MRTKKVVSKRKPTKAKRTSSTKQATGKQSAKNSEMKKSSAVTKASQRDTAKLRRVNRKRTKIGIRERLGQLTYHGACKLMHEQEGADRLRQGGGFEINLPRDTRFVADMFRVNVQDHQIAGFAEVTFVEVPAEPRGLMVNCNRCEDRCQHVAAALNLILDEKLTLGLSAPPDPDEPLENLTEQELIRRALADRQNRAEQEPMQLKSMQPKKPWTDYVITSYQSGKSWHVSLRGLESGQSLCNCPDFRNNHLGTCKHILFAINSIKKKFSQRALARDWQPTNLSLRVDYGAEPGLRFEVPETLGPDVLRIIKPFTGGATQETDRVVRAIAKLEQSGHSVYIYPDAEELIDQRLEQERLKKLAADIRANPAQHPLRKKLLKVELLPYQMDGIAFVVGAGRAILADDMGLGKTIQGIGVAELLAQQTEIRRVMVVCPASVKSQWRSEIERFSDRPCQVVLGNGQERVAQYNNDTFFTICNYEQIIRDHASIEQVHWDLIILDEGQRIKNWESQTSRMIKALRSRFALVLSGTPLENRLEELFTVAGFIDPRRLGPAYRFFHQHRVVDERGKVIGYRNLDQLRETMRPFLLRRTRQGVMQELPERTTEIVRIEPTEEQFLMSNDYVKCAAQVAAKPFLTEMDLIRLQKYLLCARMACDSTWLVNREEPGYSSKLERMAELLEQLAAEPQRKMILFSEWTRMLDLTEPILKNLGIRFVRLDGSVPQKKRQQIIWEFQNDPECRAIIMSNAGTTGLNLQAANTVINIDLPWNPAVLEQRIGRAHRMGQKNPVDVYLLVTSNTIEERMLGTLSAKHDLAMAALDSGSKVKMVELQSGIEELKKRMEVLLGEKPPTPLDESMRRRAEENAAAAVDPLQQRRNKVASAGGELLGAALNLIGELISNQQAPDQHAVAEIEKGLADCAEPQSDGRMSLRIDLPDQQALNRLATTLASLLVAPK